ncbi:hypothetical protein JOD24_001519 [Kroppenstedtia sanguinis]|uniref:DUF3862 domain-containing protein n=1 Tax=Kroppenstedtia sanguinis TaxID=1380684 RepID=A0ABW4CC87_9BACL
MSYKEVANTIGFEGEESIKTRSAEPNIMYTWMNPDGSNMNAMFQNETSAKTQFGLK